MPLLPSLSRPHSPNDDHHHHQHRHDSQLHPPTKPYIDIILDAPYFTLRGTGPDVEPTTLSGNVLLYLTEPTSIKEISLQFRGKARIPVPPSESLTNNNTCLTYTICNHTWSFLEGSQKHTHTLKSGRHFFPFHLQIGGSLPSSISTPLFGGASIAYKLRALASRPLLSHNLQQITPVHIIRSFAHEALEYQQTLEIENSWPHKLMYSIVLPHKAWAMGDWVGPCVKFSPLVKGVKVLSVLTHLMETVRVYTRSGSLEDTRVVVSARHEIADGNAVLVDEEGNGDLDVPGNVTRTTSGAQPNLGEEGDERSSGSPSRSSSFVRSSAPSPSPLPPFIQPSNLNPIENQDQDQDQTPSPSPTDVITILFFRVPISIPSRPPSPANSPSPFHFTSALSSPPSSPHPHPSSSSSSSTSHPSPSPHTPHLPHLPHIHSNSTRPPILPTHSLEPISVSHRIRWSIFIQNPDGHMSELRCSLPIVVLDGRLLDEARGFSNATRRVVYSTSGSGFGFGAENAFYGNGNGGGGDSDSGINLNDPYNLYPNFNILNANNLHLLEDSSDRELPSYTAHVRDRVANMYLPEAATVRVTNPWIVRGALPVGGGGGGGGRGVVGLIGDDAEGEGEGEDDEEYDTEEGEEGDEDDYLLMGRQRKLRYEYSDDGGLESSSRPISESRLELTPGSSSHVGRAEEGGVSRSKRNSRPASQIDSQPLNSQSISRPISRPNSKPNSRPTSKPTSKPNSRPNSRPTSRLGSMGMTTNVGVGVGVGIGGGGGFSSFPSSSESASVSPSIATSPSATSPSPNSTSSSSGAANLISYASDDTVNPTFLSNQYPTHPSLLSNYSYRDASSYSQRRRQQQQQQQQYRHDRSADVDDMDVDMNYGITPLGGIDGYNGGGGGGAGYGGGGAMGNDGDGRTPLDWVNSELLSSLDDDSGRRLGIGSPGLGSGSGSAGGTVNQGGSGSASASASSNQGGSRLGGSGGGGSANQSRTQSRVGSRVGSRIGSRVGSSSGSGLMGMLGIGSGGGSKAGSRAASPEGFRSIVPSGGGGEGHGSANAHGSGDIENGANSSTISGGSTSMDALSSSSTTSTTTTTSGSGPSRGLTDTNTSTSTTTGQSHSHAHGKGLVKLGGLIKGAVKGITSLGGGSGGHGHGQGQELDVDGHQRVEVESLGQGQGSGGLEGEGYSEDRHRFGFLSRYGRGLRGWAPGQGQGQSESFVRDESQDRFTGERPGGGVGKGGRRRGTMTCPSSPNFGPGGITSVDPNQLDLNNSNQRQQQHRRNYSFDYNTGRGILHRAFTEVPDYSIAARGFIGGGVPPLESMRGLPSYEEAAREGVLERERERERSRVGGGRGVSEGDLRRGSFRSVGMGIESHEGEGEGGESSSGSEGGEGAIEMRRRIRRRRSETVVNNDNS